MYRPVSPLLTDPAASDTALTWIGLPENVNFRHSLLGGVIRCGVPVGLPSSSAVCTLQPEVPGAALTQLLANAIEQVQRAAQVSVAQHAPGGCSSRREQQAAVESRGVYPIPAIRGRRFQQVAFGGAD